MSGINFLATYSNYHFEFTQKKSSRLPVRQIRRRWRDVRRPWVASQELLRLLVIRVRAHGPEEIPEASSLAGMDRAVSRQHRHPLLGWRRRATLVLQVGRRFRNDDTTLGRAHLAASSPPKQGGKAVASD